MCLWSEMVHAEDMVFFLSAFQCLCVIGSTLVLRAWCLLVVVDVPGRCLVHVLGDSCVLETSV